MSDDLFDIFNEEPAPASSLASVGGASSSPPGTGTAADSDAKCALSATDAPLQKASSSDMVLLDDSTNTVSPARNKGASPHPVVQMGTSQSPDPRLYASQRESSSLPSQQLPRTAMTSPAAVAMPPPAPQPFNTTTTVLSPHTSSGGAVMIIRASPSTDGISGGAHGEHTGGTTKAPPPASAIFTETHSRIRVRRATVAMEQLSVRLAEFSFVSFAAFRQTACRNGAQAPVPHTCIGVVTRKSDPKQSTTQTRAARYAVLTLWSMESISPSPETEISLLLCGDAFELLYSQLVRGSVVALSNVAMCPRKGERSSSSGGNGAAAAGADADVLLRVSDHTVVRQLGFAADLGTCSSVSHRSNERCHVVVNTLLSQHCSYHVGDLRKVARGTASSSSNNSVSSSLTPSRSAATPIMKGGTLTSHMALKSPSTSTTGAVAAAAARRADTFIAGTSAITARGNGLLTPAAAARTLSPASQPYQRSTQPVPNARLAASQQVLRQQSFFAVRGGTGLPVEDAALRRGVNSAGSGVYGGVQAGAPLPLTQQVGLRPAARYPTSQELGVTSRGRDVLEAARRHAVLSEEEKLLKRSLQPSTQKTAMSPPLVGGVVTGGGAGGGNGTTATGSATRVRERDGSGGTASSDGDASTAQKRTRTDPASTAVASPSSTVASPSCTSNTAAAGATDAQRIAALRAQFQPLHRTTPAAFAPLSGHGGVHSVIASAVQRDYRHSVVITGGTDGSGDAQTAMLRAAATAAREVAKAKPVKREGKGGHDSAGGGGAAATGEAALPLTLLGAVASGMQSAHDHLRGEADRQRLLSFVDKQITKEKALEALEAVTQQEIKAYYCYGCKRWYAKPPTTCVEQHHRTELKPALKKYIKCEHCSYKTFVIGGEDAKGWKVFPRCPRCHEASFWVRGDAAPQIAGPVEEPTPD